MKLPEGVSLVNARIADENDDVMLVTAARPRDPLPDHRDPRLQGAAARPACAASGWRTATAWSRCRSSAISRPTRRSARPTSSSAALMAGATEDEAEADEEEEAVAAGQLSAERYAEMSAAEDLILTITAGGLGQALLQPRLSGARPRRHGRQGDGSARCAAGRWSPPSRSRRRDQIMLATSTGQSIRVPVEQISLPLALGGRRARCSTPAATRRSSRSRASPNRATTRRDACCRRRTC